MAHHRQMYIFTRFYIGEISCTKQELKVTKEMLEDSKEENASLEAESQRYVNMIRSIK